LFSFWFSENVLKFPPFKLPKTKNCFFFHLLLYPIPFPPHTHTRTDTPNLPILYIRSKTKCCCTVRISLLSHKKNKTREDIWEKLEKKNLKKTNKKTKRWKNEVNKKRKITKKKNCLFIYLFYTHILFKSKNQQNHRNSIERETGDFFLSFLYKDVLCVSV
jgi:hypothetical protein